MGVINDPIADLIVRIKNANQRKHKSVVIPCSKTKISMLKILKVQGFIHSYKIIDQKNNKKELEVSLKYKGGQRVITGIKRVSKPGLRVYVESISMPKVLSGFGIAIVSTSKGIITGKEARKANVGGEVLAYV